MNFHKKKKRERELVVVCNACAAICLIPTPLPKFLRFSIVLEKLTGMLQRVKFFFCLNSGSLTSSKRLSIDRSINRSINQSRRENECTFSFLSFLLSWPISNLRKWVCEWIIDFLKRFKILLTFFIDIKDSEKGKRGEGKKDGK